jgi:Na+-transporting NADH:ubiquinone oxidoreductase subunit F
MKIDINNGKIILEVPEGRPLLKSLLENNINVPTSCGGRGFCGQCRVKVSGDAGLFTDRELAKLSEDERNTGIRLACQVVTGKDLMLDLPQDILNTIRHFGNVISINDLTYDIKEITVELSDPDGISFKAGQFIQLVIPPYESITGTTLRSFSLSSRTSDPKHAQLIIRYVPDGLATTYIHRHLTVGDEIQFTGPYGDFHIRDTAADIIFVAGGSGMAPIRSMLYDLYEKGVNNRPIWFFFGAKTIKDLFYMEELLSLQAKWNNFHFIPALSSPESTDAWNGEKGLITEVLDRYLSGILIEDKEKEGYLCGSPGMIKACCDIFNKNGVPADKLYYDSFA